MKRASLTRKTPLRPLSARLRARVREFQRWAMDVKARDDGTCAACLDREWHPNSLEAHHVYPKGKYPELRTVMENGLTLCRLCHKDWHSHSRGWMIWWRSSFPDREAVIKSLLASSSPAAPAATSGRSPRKAGER